MEVIRRMAVKYKTLKTVYAKKKRSKKLGSYFCETGERGERVFFVMKNKLCTLLYFFSIIDLPV